MFLRSGRRGNKGIIRLPSCAPPRLARSPAHRTRDVHPFPPQTWWLLNLILVSFDKLPCLHRDIPLTQPLVIVYTASRQSRRALSGFDSNIHFASEVRYPKWLDHSSLFLQLLPPFLPHSVSAHTNIIWDWRHDSVLEESTIYINTYTLLFGVRELGYGGRHNFWKWTILIRSSHPLLQVCVWDVVHRHRGLVSSFFSPLNNAVIGHSMSKGIKKRQPSLHRLLLPVAFNYFN